MLKFLLNMKTKLYDVPLIKQGLQNCVQASAAQILNFYGINKSIKDIQKEVPVYISKNGKPLGTSLGHIAAYFATLGFSVTLHTVDVEIFDQSWGKISQKKLIENLKKRRPFVKHARYDNDALDVIFDGYLSLLKLGGNIKLPLLNKKYIENLLANGPVYAVVSYNFLNSSPKFSLDKHNKLTEDSIKGEPATHAIVLAGLNEDKFLIVDPDEIYGGKRWISSERLIGSIYLAETDFDCLLITLRK